MAQKVFRLRPDQIREVAPGRGSCIASDDITVGGKPVGYMYRETPDNDIDSGWRFFSGHESQAFADDASNFELCDVNTIVNYDRDIVAFLDSPPGSAFERTAGGAFAPVQSPVETD